MTSEIKTFKDLLKEKESLEKQLELDRMVLREDLRIIKEELRPARQTMSFIGKFFTKDKSVPLVTSGANFLIDLVVKKILLGRAGWLTRLIVPLLIKNFSSHLLVDKRTGLLTKLAGLFSKNGTQSRKTDIKHESPGRD